MAKPHVLIVEDIASLAMTYAAQLEEQGMTTSIAASGAEALQQLRSAEGNFSAILLDLQLPDVNGLELLKDHPDLMRAIPFVVATADGSMARAIEAMRLGAFDFLVKPLAAGRLVTTIKSAIQTGHKAQPAPEPVRKSGTAPGFQGFVGQSASMQAVFQQISNVARSKATVFITGESGTGKEVCAEAIHKASPRAQRPFIAINCGAIPSDLMESELFGHHKGSFTGAISDRVGAVQSANGGTLFLDEICEMELKLQVKLLRFLQTGTVQRVGSSKSEDVDVRIVCATNRDPEAEVAAGRFREDLYYRLAVIPMKLPPLRSRGADLGIIANHFLQTFGREEGKEFGPLSPDFIAALGQYNWPGNVRELQNFIRRAVVLHSGPTLPLDVIPSLASLVVESHRTAEAARLQQGGQQQGAPLAADDRQALMESLSGMTLDEVERLVIDHAIRRSGGSLPMAARQLGISPSTLYRKRERWAEAAG